VSASHPELTHRWTLRETDLYNYAQALREIENMRVDGVFVDAEGNKAEGQYVGLCCGSPCQTHQLTRCCISGVAVLTETVSRSHLPFDC
jgi:hypothetical protein